MNQLFMKFWYKSTSEFNNFLPNFEGTLNTTASSYSLFTIILGDCNDRSTFWWNKWQNYSRGYTSGGPHILTWFCHQLVSEPNDLLPTSTPCIDLIFTDQPNLKLIVVHMHPLILSVITKSHITNSILTGNNHLHINV